MGHETILDLHGVKNLVIDLGGVLINLRRRRCMEAFESLGMQHVRERIINGSIPKSLLDRLEVGSITVGEFRDEVRALAGLPFTDEQIDTAWVKMLGDIPETKLELLLDLRQRYNTFLLSNTNEIHWRWSESTHFTYKGLTAADFFHKIYLSYELHMLKPDPGIFEYVLRDAGIKAEETLLIDDAAVNCQVAETLGIRTYMPQPREDWTPLFR